MMFTIEMTVKYAPSTSTPTVKEARSRTSTSQCFRLGSGREQRPRDVAGGCGDRNPSAERLETALVAQHCDLRHYFIDR